MGLFMLWIWLWRQFKESIPQFSHLHENRGSCSLVCFCFFTVCWPHNPSEGINKDGQTHEASQTSSRKMRICDVDYGLMKVKMKVNVDQGERGRDWHGTGDGKTEIGATGTATEESMQLNSLHFHQPTYFPESLKKPSDIKTHHQS